MSNKSRTLDRSSYSTRTISTYEIISAYIVDIYYNHLYVEAGKMKTEGKVPSITEGYRHAVFAMLSSIDPKTKTYKPQYYTQLLTGIKEYFTTYTSYSVLTINDCIDKITQEFIPPQYYPSLDRDQKRNILRTILLQSIKEFSRVVVTEYLSLIIDNHDDPVNAIALKDNMVDLMILERERRYREFLDSNMDKNAEVVSKKFVVELQQKFKDVNKEIKKLSSDRLILEEHLKVRTQQVATLLEKYKELSMRYKGLREEYVAVKDKMNHMPAPMPAPVAVPVYMSTPSDVSASRITPSAPPKPPRKPRNAEATVKHMDDMLAQHTKKPVPKPVEPTPPPKPVEVEVESEVESESAESESEAEPDNDTHVNVDDDEEAVNIHDKLKNISRSKVNMGSEPNIDDMY